MGHQVLDEHRKAVLRSVRGMRLIAGFPIALIGKVKIIDLLVRNAAQSA